VQLVEVDGLVGGRGVQANRDADQTEAEKPGQIARAMLISAVRRPPERYLIMVFAPLTSANDAGTGPAARGNR
jgi:hypothetical protein